MNGLQTTTSTELSLFDRMQFVLSQTKEQLALFPTSRANITALGHLNEITALCEKNLKNLQDDQRFERQEKRFKELQSKITLLECFLDSSKTVPQLDICSKALVDTKKSIHQLSVRNSKEKESTEFLEKCCDLVLSKIEMKKEEVNNSVDICVRFTTENVGMTDRFALCADDNKHVFTYDDSLTQECFDKGAWYIQADWKNEMPSSLISRKFEFPANSSHAVINPKSLPFPEISLRLCCESDELETVSFKPVKIDEAGKKFWMEGKNIIINVKEAASLSNLDHGFDLGTVHFEKNPAN